MRISQPPLASNLILSKTSQAASEIVFRASAIGDNTDDHRSSTSSAGRVHTQIQNLNPSTPQSVSLQS